MDRVREDSNWLIEALWNRIVHQVNESSGPQLKQRPEVEAGSSSRHIISNQITKITPVEIARNQEMSTKGFKQEKIRRKSFAVEQLLALECQYSQCKYLKGQNRLRLAKQLNLTDAQVKIWFQNRRAKDSRHAVTQTKPVPQKHHQSIRQNQDTRVEKELLLATERV